MFSVYLYTDQPVLAAGFAAALAPAPGFGPLAAFATLAEFLSSGERRPDVLVVDLTGDITFDDLRRVCAGGKPVVLWVHHITVELACQVMRLGVRGILRKAAGLGSVVECLRRVAAGECWFEEALAAGLSRARTVRLTRRESDIAGLIALGLPNKEIAARLAITPSTVKVYVSKLFQKLGVGDRYELALLGWKNEIGLAIGSAGSLFVETYASEHAPEAGPGRRIGAARRPANLSFDPGTQGQSGYAPPHAGSHRPGGPV